jgi:predicted dehydrogenase
VRTAFTDEGAIMFRAALIGCGPRGCEHGNALAQLAGVKLVGICDREPAVLAPAIRALAAPGYSSIAELLDHSHPEIVVVATPPQIRRSVVEQVADFPGIRAIVIEKPLALSLADGQAMAEACASRGILGVVGHQLRHAPEFIALKQAIAAGQIGELEFLRGVCYGNLLNQGVHLIDLMRWLAGDRLVQWVMSQQTDDPELLARFHQGDNGASTDRAHPAPQWMTHHLAFEGGLRATLETGLLYCRSRSFQDDWLQKRVTALGSHGVAESQAASHCRILAAGQPWRRQEFTLPDYQSATRALHEEVLSALRGDGSHRNDIRAALPSLEATLACLRSAARGELTALPLEPMDNVSSANTSIAVKVPTPQGCEAPPQPHISVVFPLPDHRGLALDAVASWARGQSYPRDRFELVLLSDGAEPELDDKIRALLGPSDRLIVHRTDNESLLYDLGAREARGRWLLFSEPHCLAEPQCLSELADYLATHAVDGACLRSIGISPTRMAQLEERQYDIGFAQFGRAGDWRKVILRGVALSREAYLQSGGFEHEFGRFSEWALGATLHAQGRRLGYAAGAAVRHLYTTHMSMLLPHVLSFSAGEIRYRDHQPAEYCDRYFGLPAEWAQRGTGQRDAARALCQAMRRRLLRFGKRHDARRLFSTWLRQLPVAWFGWRPRRWAATLAMRWAMLRCWLSPNEANYWHMYQQIARLGRIQGLAQRATATPPALTEPGVFSIDDVPEDSLIGFHPREVWKGEPFRWTGPITALPLALPAGDYELTLEMRDLYWRHAAESLHLTLDGKTLRCETNGARESLRCRFTIAARRKQTVAWLVLTCEPRQPWKEGQPDSRELGLPIFAVRVAPIGEGEIRVLSGRVTAAAIENRPEEALQH